MHSISRNSTALCVALVATLGSAASQVVINEVAYDGPGFDNGQVFVELRGPGGMDISGWSIQAIEGRAGSGGTCNPQLFVFPASTTIPGDGFVVVADGDGTGATSVANADFIDDNFDLENGADAVQLLDAGGNYVDAVAYGAVDTSGGAASACNGQNWFEGSPARDVFAPLSIERCPAGSDTGDNATDFTPNSPTPGTGEACCGAIEWISRGARNVLSAGAGDAVGLDFWINPCGQNQPYVVIAALTDPTVVPPPPPFPVLDGATLALVPLAGIPPFVAWSGTLGPNGESVGAAALDFTAGPVPVPSGFTFYVGAVALNAGAGFPIVGTAPSFVEITVNP